MQTNAMLDELLSHGIVVTDGAWGTELQSLGLAAGEIPDLWNLARPELVEKVARSYVEAGSDVILTNTFRANRIALGDVAGNASIEELNRAGVGISKRAARGHARVFASIGPSGKMLVTGQVDEATLSAAFREQAQALAEAGADALVVETMTDLTEARIAVEAAVATGLPVVGCMVFDSGEQRDRTMMGVTVAQAVETLAAAGAHVVGANCGIGIEHALPVCRAMRAATTLPLWIKPNAGLPEFSGGRTVYRTEAAAFAGYVPDLVAAGANFIGACCGSTPAFVAAIRKQLKRG
jgi:5-methyltetrahydrofolate--homocysteine methyltransferase